MDLDGHTKKKLWLYIVPHSTQDLFLGKKWLEDQEAIIHAKKQQLELRKTGGCINSVKIWRQRLQNIARPRIASAEFIASMVGTVPVCRATLEDINKAPRKNPSLTVEESKKRLLEQVKELAKLFSDDNGANDLPPLRESLDHAINLKQEDGKSLTLTTLGTTIQHVSGRTTCVTKDSD